VHKAVNVSNPR